MSGAIVLTTRMELGEEMGLPKQVERQAEEAAEIERQLAAAQQGAAEPEAAPEAVQEQAPQPAVQAQAAPQPDPWEHKYRSLQGINERIRSDAAQRERELQAQIDALREQVEAAAQAPKQEASLVTDDDRANFGEDLLDVARRIAQEQVQPLRSHIDALMARNKVLEEQLGNTAAQMGAMSFEQRLASMVPDFDKVNADPAWMAWLDEVDPMLRGPRRAAAQDAFSRGDAQAVADYVALFRQAAQPADRRAQELSRQVQPARSGAATVPTATGKYYSEADAQEMFNQVRRLNSQSRFDEADAIEAEISAAYQEGRVV